MGALPDFTASQHPQSRLRRVRQGDQVALLAGMRTALPVEIITEWPSVASLDGISIAVGAITVIPNPAARPATGSSAKSGVSVSPCV
jgi:hypothetical protein